MKRSILLCALMICMSLMLNAQVTTPGANGRHTFFTSGTSNFTVPSGVTNIFFEAAGGGGGRGGKFFTGTDYRWGGGGGGGFVKG